MYAAISRPLMMRALLEFSSVSICCDVVSPMVSLHTKHSRLEFCRRLQFLSTIRPSLLSMWEWGGLISIKCVGISARQIIRFRHRFCSSCTCAVRSTLLTSEVLRACYNLLNISTTTCIDGMALRIKPKSRNHSCLGILLDILGITSRARTVSILLFWEGQAPTSRCILPSL